MFFDKNQKVGCLLDAVFLRGGEISIYWYLLSFDRRHGREDWRRCYFFNSFNVQYRLMNQWKKA